MLLKNYCLINIFPLFDFILFCYCFLSPQALISQSVNDKIFFRFNCSRPWYSSLYWRTRKLYSILSLQTGFHCSCWTTYLLMYDLAIYHLLLILWWGILSQRWDVREKRGHLLLFISSRDFIFQEKKKKWKKQRHNNNMIPLHFGLFGFFCICTFTVIM